MTGQSKNPTGQNDDMFHGQESNSDDMDDQLDDDMIADQMMNEMGKSNFDYDDDDDSPDIKQSK